MKQDSDQWSKRIFYLGTGSLLIYLAWQIISPFTSALLTAAIIATLFQPLHARLLARIPKYPNTMAALSTALISLLISLPLILAGRTILRESIKAYPIAQTRLQDFVIPAPSGEINYQSLLSWTDDSFQSWGKILSTLIAENLGEIGAAGTRMIKALFSQSIMLFLSFIVFLMALFFFLRDGPALIRAGITRIPLDPSKTQKILTRVGEMMRAIIDGIFLVAFVQGLLAWLGFALFRLPFSALLGSLCALFSPIPWIGSSIIWMPVVGQLLLSADYTRAAGLALWFLFIVGLSDNIVRPIFIGTRTKVPIPLAVIGLIGGIKAFGVSGVVIGPIILSLLWAGFEILSEAPHEHD